MSCVHSMVTEVGECASYALTLLSRPGMGWNKVTKIELVHTLLQDGRGWVEIYTNAQSQVAGRDGGPGNPRGSRKKAQTGPFRIRLGARTQRPRSRVDIYSPTHGLDGRSWGCQRGSSRTLEPCKSQLKRDPGRGMKMGFGRTGCKPLLNG